MARKYGTNEEVIKAFALGDVYPEINSNGSVSHYDNILFSYREPIAVRRDDGLIMVNGDKWSVTTSQHQSDLQANIIWRRNYFTTSFSAIARFVEIPRRMMAQCLRDGRIEVLDHTEDFIAHYVRKENVFKSKGVMYKIEDLPAGVEIRYSKDEFGNVQPSLAHMAASCLLKYGDRYGLASMDELQYFCSELPRSVHTVDGAFHALKPQEVLENEVALPVFRQGEWFFIPHLVGKEAREQYNQMETDFKLVGKNGGNPHIATRGVWLDEQQGTAEVSGQIRHEEHRMLKLSKSDDPVIFVAVENTAVRSFSAMGRVD